MNNDSPLCCFSCGANIAHLYTMYKEEVARQYQKIETQDFTEEDLKDLGVSDIKYINHDSCLFNSRGLALNVMGIDRYCCRRMYLTDTKLVIMDKI